MTTPPEDTDVPSEAFAGSLRAAIAERGLSLARLRYHLQQHGHELSVATLSYWQSGRSRPDRASSLAALGSLEEILRVPRGSLAARLPARARRPGAPRTTPMRVEPIFDTGAFIDDVVHGFGIDWGDLEPVTLHNLITVTAQRTLGSHLVRETSRATRDGVDRMATFYGGDPSETPYIMARRNCRLGRVVEHPQASLVVAELLFDQPLGRGDSVLVEYECAMAGQPKVSESWEVGCPQRHREVHIEVEFTPPALPSAVRGRVVQGDADQSEPIDLFGNLVSLLRLDFGPGMLGLYWTW